MQRNKWIATLLGLMIFTTPAHAQEVDVTTVPIAEKAEAWLVESRDVPIITVMMAFRDAGSTSDTKEKYGRAQMTAALLNEGAGELDALEFNQMLESHAIKLGFGADDDLLYLQMETLTENADKAFELLALALTQPRFDEAAIARIKGQMHSGLRLLEEQPSYVAKKALTSAVLGDHPYANPTEGTHETIDAITKADLKEYLAHYITLGNLTMSVVGDVDAKALQALTKKHFSALPKTFDAQHKVSQLEPILMGQTDVVRRSIPQTVISFAGKGVARDDKDFYVAYVLNHLLGGGALTSKLGNEIREKRGLAYSVSTGLSIKDHGVLFAGGFGTRNDQAAEALKVLMDTLRATQQGDISEEEVSEAKSYIIGAFPLVLASNDGIAMMLQMMQRYKLGKDYLAKRNAYMEAVSREDVIRVAKELFNPNQMVVIGVGDPSENLADFR
ncbi:MAG: insulinase family protein [Alphaproteobacteria bacterium]|nr:insulinase family protein [Alphaproteobacteria bacterium]